jgi:DNA-binding transcriptional regulator YiaG
VTDDLAEARLRLKRKREPFASSGQATVNLKGDAVAERSDPRAYYAGKTPTPQRITAALDMRQLYGPEVDQALGGEEPMVDEWESGERIPSFEQVQRLALLTDFPVKFFYLPALPPLTGALVCGSDGCRPLGVTEERECPTCGKPR